MFNKRVLHISLVALLSLALFIAPVSPYVYANQESRFNQIQISEETRKAFEQGGIDWAEEQESVLGQLFDMAQHLDNKAQEFVETHGGGEVGEAELQSFIDQNAFVTEVPGLGTAEYRMIDGKRVPRVLLEGKDRVYLLLNQAQMTSNSEHLRQYIARTHIESGANRPVLDENGNEIKGFLGKKKQSGRDLVIVNVTEGQFSDVNYLPRSKPMKWSWWKDYFYSKYKKPTFNDFTLALVVGAGLQGALTMGMSAMKAVHLGTPMDTSLGVFAAGYSLALGTYYSMYRNWAVLSGTRLTRVLKQTTVSLAFAYGVVLLVSPGEWSDKFAAVSMMSAAGLMQNASIFANAISNNYAKDYWNQIMRIRDQTRENAKTLSFGLSLFGKKYQAEWKQATIEGQLLYLIPWSINLFALMTLATTSYFHIPGTEISLPILQFAGIPFAMLWAKIYSRRIADRANADPRMKVRARELEKMAQNYENIWKNSFGMDIRDIPKKIKNSCSKLLSHFGL